MHQVVIQVWCHDISDIQALIKSLHEHLNYCALAMECLTSPCAPPSAYMLHSVAQYKKVSSVSGLMSTRASTVGGNKGKG